MPDKVYISREVPGSASAPSGEGSSHQFDLTAAMALIVGSIIGVGIFNLPASLAVYGPITLVSMALTTVGALVLALLFAALSRRLPAFGSTGRRSSWPAEPCCSASPSTWDSAVI
jgi:basic amino acid/polyamine antiporter, APA family